jgi:hypothetical protein
VSLRITLEGESKDLMNEMIKQIRMESPDCSVKPSGVAAWIIMHFYKTNFQKLKTKIADSHFNPKAYLRLQLKDLDSAEKVEAALEEIRNKIKNTKGTPERKNIEET